MSLLLQPIEWNVKIITALYKTVVSPLLTHCSFALSYQYTVIQYPVRLSELLWSRTGVYRYSVWHVWDVVTCDCNSTVGYVGDRGGSTQSHVWRLHEPRPGARGASVRGSEVHRRLLLGGWALSGRVQQHTQVPHEPRYIQVGEEQDSDGLSRHWGFNKLTHWDQNKMAGNLQTALSHAFSWQKIQLFWANFHWSLFLWVQFTITHY